MVLLRVAKLLTCLLKKKIKTMTIEKIKKGTEILNKIKHLEGGKAKWEQSTYVEI